MKNRYKVLFLSIPLAVTSCGNGMTLRHYHYYDPSTQVWNWHYDSVNDTYDKATVTIKCTNEKDCDENEVTVEAVIDKEFVVTPNCCEEGIYRYTATATFEGTDYIQSKDKYIDKTSHQFSTEYHYEKDGHAHECIYCSLLDEDLVPHSYGSSGEAIYTCSICHYVDIEIKEAYEKELKIASLIKAIDELPNKDDLLTYHEGLIRDCKNQYDSLSDDEKLEITNIDKVNDLLTEYNKKYLVVFSSNLFAYGYDIATKETEKNVKVTRDVLSSYGYGYEVNVLNQNNKNAVLINSEKPAFGEKDGVVGEFYTHNLPSDMTVRFVTLEGDFMIGGSDKLDLGNGWVKHIVNETRMGNLLKYNYKQFYLEFAGSSILEEGQYFISSLYGIRPEKPMSGVHYTAKNSTETETGNLEYWMFDGNDTVYFNNPDPSITWVDSISPELSPTHIAFIGKRETRNISSTDASRWSSNSAHSTIYLKTGLNLDKSEGGEYVLFRNYLWESWPEAYAGLTATYSLDNEEVVFSNTISFDYVINAIVTPIELTITVIDQNNNETVAVDKETFDSVKEDSLDFTFLSTNVKEIKFYTKAYKEKESGENNIFIKNIKVSYGEIKDTVGIHYSATRPGFSATGNKEYWVDYATNTPSLTNPLPTENWDEKVSPTLGINHVAYLAPLMSSEGYTMTTYYATEEAKNADTHWSKNVGAGNPPKRAGLSVQTWSDPVDKYSSDSTKSGWAVLQTNAWNDANNNNTFAELTYTFSDSEIKTINSISLYYFVGGSMNKNNVHLDIIGTDLQGNKVQLGDTLTVGNSGNSESTYRVNFTMNTLRSITFRNNYTSQEALESQGGSSIYIRNLKAEFIWS